MRFEIYPEAHDFAYENAVFDFENTVTNVNERLELAVLEAEVLLEAMIAYGADIVLEAPSTNAAGATAQNAGRTATKAGNAAGGAVKSVATAPAKGVKGAVNGVKTAAAPVTAVSKGAKSVVSGAKNVATKAKDLVMKVINFIKNLFARLIDNLQTWFQNSGKWLQARTEAFAKFNYNDLEISMVPYWEGRKSNPIQRTSRTMLQAIADMMKTGGVSKDEYDFEGFVNRRLKDYLDADGDLNEGFKNFYRVGNAKGKDRFVLKGSVLKNMVNGEMIPAILNYDSYVKEAQNIQRNLDNRCLALGREMDRRGITRESALFGVAYEQTEFALFEDFDILREAAPDSSDKNRTAVNIGRDNRNQAQKDDDKADANYANNLQNENDGELKILNNVLKAERTMMSCYLTVLQERYTAYMNALKAIWSAANNVGDRNKDVNGKDVKVGKNQKTVDEQ